VIPPDRVEAGTWIAAAVATKSPLTITRTDAAMLTSVLDAFTAMGAEIKCLDNGTKIQVIPPAFFQPIDVETRPYPGFPTDMQAQIMAALCLASGKSRIRETIFENRFMHVAELRRLGAKITIRKNLATIEGPCALRAAPVMATDLRASACLVVAALAASGSTRISRIYHLDRGYQRLDEKLSALGARVSRVSE
jgi:UDP-N-acetylglucosamine 1-carboxyvinyltransferase